MISLVKIVTEGYAFDADDYMPYDNLKVGDIVRCNQNPEDKFKILEVVGDNKLIVSLVDDPRDIRAVVFDEDVTAHASDQNSEDEDIDLNEVDVDLADKEREANAEPEQSDEFDPREILPEDCTIVAMSEGFDTVKLEEAMQKLLELPYFAETVSEENKHKPYRYVSFEMVNTPDDMHRGSDVDVNYGGKYFMPTFSRNQEPEVRRCDTVESAAPKVENLLKGMASPQELKQHIHGWILVDHNIGTHSAEFYPYLDEEGVRIYLKAKDKLSADIDRFYKGSTYWGD